MSTEIIKVLDYICAQLGIAIDWSAENVMPQVMDILGRYRVYMMANKGILIICLLLGLFVLFSLLKKCIKGISNKEGIWWYTGYSTNGPSELAITVLVLGFFAGIIALVGFCCSVSDILQWAIVPEIKYLAMLKGLMA